ncbi:MAG: hypothetical protein H8E44_23935 [Planctomycetes bacterium]|nr:hypothetical protein [Planctomycetota bacterium]
MNEFDDSPREDDQRFDRLVDGELSPKEYNDLLRSLDQQPDGWRRCALAFIEAQALRQELGGLVGEAPMPSQPASLSVHETKQPRRWPGLVAIAASFLLAFGLGVMFRGGWPGVDLDTEGMSIAEDERPESPDPLDREADIVRTPTPKVDQPGQHRGNVRLVFDRPDGSGSEAFEAPLYDYSREHEWMLSNDRFQVPPEVRRILQRMGREVRSDQQVVPLETEDGQRVLIPFRQLEITPVGGHRYQ